MSEPGQSLPSLRRLRQFELAEKLARIGHWYWAVGDDAVDWSPEVQHLFGIPAESFDAPYQQTLSILRPKAREELHTLIRQCVVDGRDFAMDLDYDHPDGTVHHFHLVGEREVGADGRTVGILGVMKDLTAVRRMARDLDLANARQEDFVDMSSDWLWEMGADMRFTYVSRQMEEALGIPADRVVGRTRRELAGEEEMSLETEMHLAWLDRHEAFRDFRYWVSGGDGERKCVSSTGRPLFDSDGAFAGYRGFARDVTAEEVRHAELQQANRDLKSANREKSAALISLQQANALLEEQAATLIRVQEEIRHAALHDPLTGIANRRYLDERMAELAERCHENGDWLAVLHIDLDRFKHINDTAGHAAGDALLVHVADILRSRVRSDDFVARIGGDEFVVVCSGAGAMRSPGHIGDRIVKAASVPFEFEGRECWFGASIGIASARGRQIRPADLLVNADIALYRAKSHGRGRVEYFSNELQAEIIHTQQIADGIRAGLARGEFVPHYQAQVDAKTCRITGFEALARWNHPSEGVLPPSAFLHIAEELNAVATIDRLILEATVADHRRWSDAGHAVPRLSVNVSARRLRESELIASLRAMDLPRGTLSFELLESVFLDDADETILWNIDMLKEMGIDVELDDFGSGHASIISLIKLGPDAIKIDRELIQTITADRSRRDLVRSLIDIGRSLNVRVVAEGVETADQATLLRHLGCDVLQGYYFSRPIPAADVPAFVERWQASDPMARLSA